ncbi:MAG TPA: FMN-binding protein [Burkholderiales bacterium]
MRSFDASRWAPIALVCAAAPVHATQYLTVEQAQRALFPEADAFAFAPIRLTPELRARLEAESGVASRASEQRVWQASRNGQRLGSLMVDEVIGKHELITYAVAITADGAIRGLEVLDYRESRGGEVRDPRWRAQFTGKRRGAPLRLDQDIQNLSGATLSCRHITEGVRRLLALHAVAAR